MFGRGTIRTGDTPDGVSRLREALARADAVVIGAGAGLSTSAGFDYSGERFRRYFSDFAAKYHFRDMYSGGFYPYETAEAHWAYWSRYIYINRYMDPPRPVYRRLFELVRDRDYFVLTTNVDHCFQKSGFDRRRLFYTQGDYGLFQCGEPCHASTYDNEGAIRAMLEAQGYAFDADGALVPPDGRAPAMEIPAELVPRCPRCGKPMRMNLRADASFVEDDGWHAAAARYAEFLRAHRDRNVLFLELAVGWNTPDIIKFSFWRMTYQWPDAVYACINHGEACAPDAISQRSIVINGDAGDILDRL